MRKPHWILRVKNRGHDVAERQCLANCVSLEHNTTHTLGLRLQIWRNQQEQKKKTERKSAGAEWKPIEIEAGVDIIALWGMLKNQNRVGRNAGCNNRERWAAKLKTSDGFQKHRVKFGRTMEAMHAMGQHFHLYTFIDPFVGHLRIFLASPWFSSVDRSNDLKNLVLWL